MSPPEIAGALVGTLVAGLAAHRLIFVVLRRVVRRPGARFERSLVKNLDAPSRLVLPLAGLEVAIAAVGLGQPARSPLLHVIGISLIGAIAWLIIRSTYVLDDMILARYQMDVADNLRSRRIRTQIQVLRRITVVVVAILAVAIALLSFPEVRAAGAGLLASAGVLGVVAGIAARPTATNVVAGLQIALSQPIRVDDVVVVEGQWGRIEEIALTSVVVRVWDLRRLVLPISYFVEQPFENWTRSTADILGWVYIQVDYSAPVDELRSALQAILAASPNWDGKVGVLQVTTLGSETMQLRALMSSADSSRSWDLQCEVREQLVRYIQEHHPSALPHLRVRTVATGDPSVQGDDARGDGARGDDALVGAGPGGRTLFRRT